MGNQSLSSQINLQNINPFISNDCNQWLKSLNQLTKNIHQNYIQIDPLGDDVWKSLTQQFSNYYLSKHQQLQFFSLIFKIVAHKPHNQIEQLTKNQFVICGQIGQKFSSLKSRIKDKWKHCINELRFLAQRNVDQSEGLYDTLWTELKFDLSQSEVSYIAQVIRPFCEYNIDCIALLGFYFQLCVQNLSKTQPFYNIEQHLKGHLNNLQKMYPSITPQMIQIDDSYNLQSFKIAQQNEWIYFDQQKSHFEQLIDYISAKIQKAKQSEQVFIDLVQDICLQRGYEFRINVKVYHLSPDELTRIVQKIFQKQQYEQNLIKVKKYCLQNADKIIHNSQKGIDSYIEWQKQQITTQINIILNQLNKIQFISKDLLRAKFLFNTPQQIVQTVNQLQYNIQRCGYQILQLKNQLAKKQKNVFLVIKLPHTIASLQLSLKHDYIKNQFFRKLSKFKKTNIHTVITNVCNVTKRLGQMYFKQNFQLFHQQLYLNQHLGIKVNSKLQSLQQSIQNFKNKNLHPHNIRCHFTQAYKQQQKQLILRKIQQINTLISLKSQENHTNQNIKSRQKLNKINFYYKSHNSNAAFQSLSQISTQQIETNVTLLKIKAQLLYEKHLYQQSIKSYQKCAKLLQNINLQKVKCSQSESLLQNHYKFMLAVADIYSRIGKIYKTKGQYMKALHYYIEAEKISETINGMNSVECISFIQNVGSMYKILHVNPKAISKYQHSVMIYENFTENKWNKNYVYTLITLGNFELEISNYQKALQMFNKAFEFVKRNLGTQNFQCAKIYSNLSKLYLKQSYFDKALQLEACAIKIIEKFKGKISLKYAKKLSNFSQIYFKKGEIGQAQHFYARAYEVLKRLQGDQNYHIAKLNIKFGELFKEVHKYEQALRYFQSADKIFIQVKQTQTQICAKLYGLMGMAYYKIGLNTSAIQFFQKSLEIYRVIEKTISQNYTQVLWDLSKVYTKQKNNKKTIQNLQSTLDIRHKLNQKHDLHDSAIFSVMANAYKKMGKQPKAVQNLLKSLKIKQDILGKDNFSCTIQHHMLGNLYFKMKENMKALQSYEKQIGICQSNQGHILDLAYSYHCLSYVYQSQKQVLKAIQLQTQALKIFEQRLSIKKHVIQVSKKHLKKLQGKTKRGNQDSQSIDSVSKQSQNDSEDDIQYEQENLDDKLNKLSEISMK